MNRYNILTNENDKVKESKTQRVKSKKVNKENDMKIKLFATNAAGVINGKMESLKSEVAASEATVVTVQETHCKQKGKIQMNKLVSFEAIRKKKGGGTICAIHEDMEPKLIEEYDTEFEMIVIEIKVKNRNIRIITGYGPQENWVEEKRMPFFTALESEIIKAKIEGKSVIVEMDANSKLGKEFIPNDPHEISPNGQILAEIIKRQNLRVGNGSKKCRGTITRKRVTKKRTEESAIDLLLYTDDLEEEFEEMKIDEEKKNVLTKVNLTKNEGKKKESDHNVLTAIFNCKFTVKEENEKEEIYNLKNHECQIKFKEYTNKGKMLSSVFDAEEELDILVKRFLKKLKGCVTMCFKKIRVTKPKETEKDKLFKKLRELKTKDDDDSIKEMDKVINEIAAIDQDKYNEVIKKLDTLDETKVNTQAFWKIKKKMCPKQKEPPVAMKDKHGNLITSEKAIQERVLEVFSERLKPNKMKENIKHMEETTNKLCESRLKATKLNKSEKWTIDDLEEVLKELEKDKSRDALGHANEIFRKDVAGTDLKLAILKMMNLIKQQSKYPQALEPCNITPLYKNKGSKNNFFFYRGIFRVTVFRSILDRLLYNDSYPVIDEHLTDGNVGARKRRNIRDNIFVLGAITNSVIHGKQPPIQVEVMDVDTCFDKLWLQKTINALYEDGLTNNALNLLYEENRNAQVAIKVNNKITRRINIKDIIIQGSVFGSLKCTATMDKLNKLILQDKQVLYSYKNDPNIQIGVLGMVDDTLSISECGNRTIAKNAMINSFIENQRLTLSEDKSVVVHIGSQNKCKTPCPDLKIHENRMKNVKSTKYLGDVLSEKGGVQETIECRIKRGWGKVSQILGLLSDIPSGPHRIKLALKLREALLCNSLLLNSEAWSDVREAQIEKMEVVDRSLLRSLVEAHSKTPKEFLYLEAGVLKFRDMVKIRRMMYHHELLKRNDDETTKKIYMKQTESNCKGDWYRLLENDFKFIDEQIDEDKIKSYTKEEYKKVIKKKVKDAAFKEYIKEKETHKKKLEHVKYERLELQPYLTNKQLTRREINLMHKLRSKCYQARLNFRKLNKKNLKCVLNCDQLDTQSHIFEECKPLRDKLKLEKVIKMEQIYGSLEEQTEAIKVYILIDETRTKMVKDFLPGGQVARTLPDH